MTRVLTRISACGQFALASSAIAAMTLPMILLGCTTKHTTTTITKITPTQQPQFPPTPTAPPPSFTLFHHNATSITLVTADNATDSQIEAIIYQLRDAGHTHTFGRLHIPQKLVDARDPILWFHIYRGSKCASEKYVSGPPPCGPSYHAAGEYTLGSFKDPNRDEGALLHGDGQATQLWNPDAPYVPPLPLS